MNIVPVNTLGGIGDALVRMFFREPAGSEFGQTSDWVFMFIFWWSVVLFVILMGLMGWFMFKYRRVPGTIGARSPSHNTPLELMWTILPTILLVFMFFYGFWGFADALVAPGHSLMLDVQARQWSWTVTYPNGAITGKVNSVPGDIPADEQYGRARGNPGAPIKHLGAVSIPLIIVPAQTPVQLRMISNDVLHAFWVPDFRMKFDVVPNRYTAVWFEAREDQIGDHWVFCAEYCGNNHSEMLAVMRVLPKDEYEATVRAWGPEGLPPAEYGAVLYRGQGCAGCHSTDGAKNTGPTWLNMYGYEFSHTDGSTRTVDDNHIRQSILVPGGSIRAGFTNQMTPFQLSEKEIGALIAYIKTLSDRGGTPDAPPEQPAGEQPGSEQPGAQPAGGY